MNTLKAEFASQVRAIIKQLRENKELRGVVFVSAKPDNFIAGADINMIGNCKTAQEAEALARQGQQLMAEIHAFPFRLSRLFMALAWAVGWSWRWRATVAFVLTILKRCSVCLKYNWIVTRFRRHPAFTASDRRQYSIRDDSHRKTTSGETGIKAGAGG